MASLVILLGVGAVTGAAVGAVGVVVFIGLVIPPLVRRFAGAAHRVVLVGSAVGGAAMMLLADLGARTLISPQEIPVGLLTAAIGGPFFLWLIRRPEVPRL
jgi:iron complex transport system permease protein